MWSNVELILVLKAFWQIFVDADSCPVKEEIVETAFGFSAGLLFVASYDRYVNGEYTYGIGKYADSGKGAADLFIMNHAVKGDIVITQDFGLASTLLQKKIQVLSPKGILFKEKQKQSIRIYRGLKEIDVRLQNTC